MEEKMKFCRVWNDENKEYEYRKVPSGKYKFTDEDKISIVSEYVTSGRPAQEIIEKYHLSSRQVLFNWMDKYVNEREIVSLPENKDEDSRRENQGVGG